MVEKFAKDRLLPNSLRKGEINYTSEEGQVQQVIKFQCVQSTQLKKVSQNKRNNMGEP